MTTSSRDSDAREAGSRRNATPPVPPARGCRWTYPNAYLGEPRRMGGPADRTYRREVRPALARLAPDAIGRPFASTALKQSVCGIRHLFAQRGPCEQGVERWAQCLSPFRQAVLDLGRNLVMDDPADDPVGSCWMSIFWEMDGIARPRSEKRSTLPPKIIALTFR